MGAPTLRSAEVRAGSGRSLHPWCHFHTPLQDVCSLTHTLSAPTTLSSRPECPSPPHDASPPPAHATERRLRTVCPMQLSSACTRTPVLGLALCRQDMYATNMGPAQPARRPPCCSRAPGTHRSPHLFVQCARGEPSIDFSAALRMPAVRRSSRSRPPSCPPWPGNE